MLPRGLSCLVISLLTGLRNVQAEQHVFKQTEQSGSIGFTLRHIHATTNTSRVIFADVERAAVNTLDIPEHIIATQQVRTHRPLYLGPGITESFTGWDEHEVVAPDVRSRGVLDELAKMTWNAYFEPKDKDWYDLGGRWNNTPFGWEPGADGFRGHVFASQDNSTVVLTIKGTSPVFMGGGGGPTGRKDKLNDNLMFSCCCGRVGPTWWPVCGCYKGGSQCDWNCLETALEEQSLFYSIGTNLYNNLTYLYPDANIWITGHSLGGGLAALLGATFGSPVVAFESPGEALASRRLHLPTPPSTQHITHVYHTGDPIPQGACTGYTSACTVAGYALETKCHLGRSIVFDTVRELGWGVDVRTHPIATVIEKILHKDGDWFKNETRGLPEPIADDADCLNNECFAWEYV